MSEGRFNVCVFCGSSEGSNPDFMAVATELGEQIAEAGYGLVYGAGGTGIMGAVSNGALSKGGHVTGVIPEEMMAKEWGRLDISDLQVVETIHVRKTTMYSLASVLVTLPGGYGTLEEFFESLTWIQLGYHSRVERTFVLNVDGYYDSLKALIDQAHDSSFIRPGDRELVTFVDTVDGLLKELSTISQPSL